MKLEQRSYTKKELAVLCHPDVTTECATMRFYRDCKRCKALQQLLHRSDVTKARHLLSHHQAILILTYVYPDILD